MQDNDLPQIGTPMQTDETRAREVIQADRDAAATAMCSKARNVAIERIAGKIRRGELDSNTWVQSHARHRAAFAAPPAVERVESIALDVAETITAHMRSPDMIWGLGRIDPELLGEMEAELRSITVAALTNALSALSQTLHPSDREAGEPSGIDAESAAWDWVHKTYSDDDHDAVDRAYGADEMVDAFHAGRSWLRPSDREAIAREVPSTAERIDVKAIWKAHGGSQHGPNVEQYYIEEQAFYRFASAYRDAILALSGSLAPEGGDYPCTKQSS